VTAFDRELVALVVLFTCGALAGIGVIVGLVVLTAWRPWIGVPVDASVFVAGLRWALLELYGGDDDDEPRPIYPEDGRSGR